MYPQHMSVPYPSSEQRLMQLIQVMVIFWTFTPFSVFGFFHCFGRTDCLHVQGDNSVHVVVEVIKKMISI